jgi:hypothetical protein
MEPTIFRDDDSSKLKSQTSADAHGGLPSRPPMPRIELTEEALYAINRPKLNGSRVADLSVLRDSASDCSTSPDCETAEFVETNAPEEALSPNSQERLRKASIKAAHHNLPSYIYAEDGINAEIEQADLPKRGVRNRKLPGATLFHNSASLSPTNSSPSTRSASSPSSSPLVLDSSALIRPPWEATT